MRLLLVILCLLPPAMAQDTETPSAPKPQEAKPLASAAEQVITGDLDFGYRWTSNVGGSAATYRSIVNLGEGPKLFNLNLSLRNGARKVFDKLNVRANSWGGDPYNTAHLDVERDRAYRLSADYRNIIYFSAEPSFGNPLLNQGVLTSQNSYDLHRRLFDVDLDLLPSRRVTPYLAYTRDWGEGRGVTDFVADSNQYPVADHFRDKTDQYRGGLRIELTRLHVTLEQGGTTFKDDQRLLTSDRNFGNRVAPIFGQQLLLDYLNQAYGVRGDSIYSKALVTVTPASWLDVYGQFLYSRPQSDVKYSQINTGLFVNSASLAFFSAQNSIVLAEAKQPHTSGSFGMEVRPVRRVRILESLTSDHFHISSSSLEDDLFWGITPGLPPVTAISSIPYVTPLVVNYNRQEVDLLVDATKKVTLRAGHRYEWGDAQARASTLSQTGLAEMGELKRQVGLAGFSYRPDEKLSLYFDFEDSGSAQSYFRTSLHDYQKGRARVKYQVMSSLTVSANLSVLNNQNPAPGIRYDFLSRENGITLFWTPRGGKRISFLGDYTRSSLRSDLDYLVPQTLQPARSFYRDNAHTGTGFLEFHLPSMKQGTPLISVGGSVFSSSGSRPTHFYQPVGRFTFPIHKKLWWFGEWRWYDFSEPFYLFEGFRTHNLILGFRAVL
jgi:hypothetical protein